MEENDILGQYNLPHEVEKYYYQVDTLRAYNVQNWIDILYTQDPEGTNLNYNRVKKSTIIRDALADYAFPGLKNDLRGDGSFLFLSNMLGGTIARAFPFGLGEAMLLPRPGIGTEGYATNLNEVLIASLSQCESVRLGGELIELIKNDLDMQEKEKVFINKMIKNEEFIQIGKFRRSFSVQFGGSRGNGDGSWTTAAFDAARNPLTWIIRNTFVIADAVKNTDESVTITYSLDPNEKLDLRPGNREFWYEVITAITGFFYHDIYRGNDQMRIKAIWSTTIQPYNYED